MESIAFTGENEIFRKLEKMASFASLGEADRLAYEIELKAYNDLLGQLEYAEDKGRSEGRAEGMQKGLRKGRTEGRAEGRAEMILSMAREGLSLETISRVAKVAVDEIKKILSAKK